MKHEKFLQDAKRDPGRFYRQPGDVIRDRRLTNGDRLDILSAWERTERQALAQGAGEDHETRLRELARLREDVKGSGDP